MNGKALKQNRRLLLFAFVIGPILITAILLFVSQRLYTDQRRAMKLVEQSVEGRAQLIELRNDLDEAEAAEYGFLISGSQSFLQRSLFAQNDTYVRLTFIGLWFVDQPAQLARLSHLRLLTEAKLAEFRDVARLKQSGQDQKALRLISTNREGLGMDQIQPLIAEIQTAADQTLAERRAENESKVNLRDLISICLLCLTVAVVVGAGVLLLRIRQLQSIITICAWTQRVNFHGKWMRMEDFLWQRFRVKVSHGISEEAFEGVMGMVGKNLTVSNDRAEKLGNPKAQPDADPGK
jgi:CHASE3 domain sensor protein